MVPLRPDGTLCRHPWGDANVKPGGWNYGDPPGFIEPMSPQARTDHWKRVLQLQKKFLKHGVDINLVMDAMVECSIMLMQTGTPGDARFAMKTLQAAQRALVDRERVKATRKETNRRASSGKRKIVPIAPPKVTPELKTVTFSAPKGS